MIGIGGWTARVCVAGVLACVLMVAAQGASASDATTSWTQVTGQPALTGVTLSGVTCTSATRCVAHGRRHLQLPLWCDMHSRHWR
jgi:hypothetical protein